VRLEHDERRASILASARQLFCERPYDEVSMGDVAAASGVVRGLVNHYFGSKRDLYLAVVREVVKVPTLPLPEAAASLPVDVVWEASVDGWLDLIESNRELWLMAIGTGAAGRDPELEEILDGARELVARRAVEALRLDDGPEVMAIVRGFGGMAEEVTREWLVRERLTRVQARALLVRALPLLVESVLPDVEQARRRGRRSR
jgi:AcrR family transcriptional regulator